MDDIATMPSRVFPEQGNICFFVDFIPSAVRGDPNTGNGSLTMFPGRLVAAANVLADNAKRQFE